MSFYWPPIVVLAAALQTARNAVQRGLLESAGPWGATLVRFLFGLPFALVWLAGWALATRIAVHVGPRFLVACLIAAIAQTVATAALLVSMRRSGFAIGAAFSQARLPFAMIGGLAIGDWPAPLGLFGVTLATAGLFTLSWPEGVQPGNGKATEGDSRKGDWSAAGFGLLSGGLFAMSANAVRAAGHTAAPSSTWLGAAATLACVQFLQTVGLTLWLMATDRAALRAAVMSWRRSIGAGFFGFAASACWFAAFGMAPAAAVNTVGVVEMPIAAWAGRRLFRERLTWRQILGAVMTGVGVAAGALGFH